MRDRVRITDEHLNRYVQLVCEEGKDINEACRIVAREYNMPAEHGREAVRQRLKKVEVLSPKHVLRNKPVNTGNGHIDLEAAVEQWTSIMAHASEANALREENFKLRNQLRLAQDTVEKLGKRVGVVEEAHHRLKVALQQELVEERS